MDVIVTILGIFILAIIASPSGGYISARGCNRKVDLTGLKISESGQVVESE